MVGSRDCGTRSLSYNRNEVPRNTKDFDKAHYDFDEAIRLDPENSLFYNIRGFAWLDMEDYKKPFPGSRQLRSTKAIKDFDMAIRFDPNNAHFYLNRGIAWMDFELAIDYFMDDSLDDQSLKEIDEGYERKPRDKAISDFDEAIRLDPAFAAAYYNRGKAEPDSEKKMKYFDESIRLSPQNAQYFFNAATPGFGGTRIRTTTRRSRTLTRPFDWDRVTPTHIGDGDMPGRARAIMTKQSRISPWLLALSVGTKCGFTASAAQQWMNKKDYDQAIKDYDEAIRLALDAKFRPNYYERGCAWFNKNDFDKAIEDFDEAIARNLPTGVPKRAYYTRGMAWMKKADFEKAIKDFGEAIHLDPAYVAAYLKRGLAWFKTRHYEKAVADFETAVRVAPEDPDANGWLASILATCPVGSLRDGNRNEACNQTVRTCGVC